MDQNSKNVVNLALARVARGDVEKERKVEKVKKVSFVVLFITVIVVGIFSIDVDFKKPLLTAQKPETKVLENGDVQVFIKQDEYGHYRFVGEINGKAVQFLLDTGATFVSVPRGIANYLKLPYGDSYYSNTANGRSLSYESKAIEVAVGGISLFDVDASISTGMEGNEILLGMSFLRNLGVSQENGVIVITSKKINEGLF